MSDPFYLGDPDADMAARTSEIRQAIVGSGQEFYEVIQAWITFYELIGSKHSAVSERRSIYEQQAVVVEEVIRRFDSELRSIEDFIIAGSTQSHMINPDEPRQYIIAGNYYEGGHHQGDIIRTDVTESTNVSIGKEIDQKNKGGST